MILPIDIVLPRLANALGQKRNVVLSAPPGAGKTTRVPLALLEEPWMTGKKLIMLEPRRLAARRAAQFMAAQLGQQPGETVGYRTRGDSRVGKNTRIEVVTEGVLTRLLHEQSELPDVALVIFDEFHERSVHADLGLAFTLDVQQNLREELRILVMSATLDHVAVAQLLGDAAIVESPGKSFPVDIRYLSHPLTGLIEPKAAEMIKKALETGHGDVLAFLPGQREIRKVEALLQDAGLPSDTTLHTLYGEATDVAQQAALAPAPSGYRKVILSTSIAETSLTIDGVRIVVDAGLSRMTQFDPRRGMSGLVTVPVSKASAEQRAGRAGRQQPGIAYRLWTEAGHQQLQPYSTPEILSADLAPLTLDVALWGSTNLRFLDPPPPHHVAQAKSLLTRLGAFDKNGVLTTHGKAMVKLPLHPRLAHMLLQGKELGFGSLACETAALLEERDIFHGQSRWDVDFISRLQALHTDGEVDRTTRKRVAAEAERLRGLIGTPKEKGFDETSPGILLGFAYPDRIARRRENGSRRYIMAGGAGATLPEGSLLAREAFLAIADVDGAGTEARIFLASPIQKEDIQQIFHDQIICTQEVSWNSREEAVVSRSQEKLGAVIISEKRGHAADETTVSAMVEGIQQMGLEALPWEKSATSFRERSEWLREQQLVEDDWPNLGNESLLMEMTTWLAPFLMGVTRRSHLAQLDLLMILRSQFTHHQLKDLDRLAPETILVPTGSKIRLSYSDGVQPVLAVRLQEMFGQTDTPMIAAGKRPVLIHLLSPAGRSLAVTRDLGSFWKNAYPDVRKEMRGRYPKHIWPEDPLNATPTRRAKRRAGNIT